MDKDRIAGAAKGIKGSVKEAIGNTSTGLLVLSLLPLAAGLLAFLGGHDTKTEFATAK